MRSHRLILRRLRRLVLGLTALALLVPVGATAVPTNNSRPPAHEDQGYAQAVASLTQEEMAAAYGTAFDTPAKVGDTPADFGDASRAPDYQAPPATDVVPPERTIVREANDALPIALAGVALFIAIAMAGFVVVRTRGTAGRLP
jgi:hypothetical protein